MQKSNNKKGNIYKSNTKQATIIKRQHSFIFDCKHNIRLKDFYFDGYQPQFCHKIWTVREKWKFRSCGIFIRFGTHSI